MSRGVSDAVKGKTGDGPSCAFCFAALVRATEVGGPQHLVV